MEPTTLALLMFAALFLLLFTGFPVAFSLGGTAVIFAVIGISTDMFAAAALNFFPLRIFAAVMDNETLLAVPFFIFMGTMLERSGLAEDLLTTIGMLFGSMRGGLALAVVFVGALLAAATGVVGASVVTMGLISLPVMLRYGYDKSFATGVITASGTLGQIIPPSIVLIILADQLLIAASPSNTVDVGALFRGALIPGLMLAGLYGIYVAGIAWLKPDLAPALPVEERSLGGSELARRVLLVLLPPLLLIVLVLGSIFFGIAAPSEAGALGAAGAVVLAGLNGRLNIDALRQTSRYTTRLSTMVMFLLVGSTAFSLIFRLLRGDDWITELLTDLPGGAIGLLIVANLVIFILGFFIDFFEIAFIILPLLAPAAAALDIPLVWFGVMIAMNLQTSFLTPPFGFALFYLRGVAPEEVPTTAIYRGAIPFIIIQLLGIGLICLFPELVTWGVDSP
jgi:tripartite ATP-independent transporter DctM subunit